MRNSRGFGAILLGVALLASGGCGLISSPQPPPTCGQELNTA